MLSRIVLHPYVVFWIYNLLGVWISWLESQYPCILWCLQVMGERCGVTLLLWIFGGCFTLRWGVWSLRSMLISLSSGVVWVFLPLELCNEGYCLQMQLSVIYWSTPVCGTIWVQSEREGSLLGRWIFLVIPILRKFLDAFLRPCCGRPHQ